MSFEQRSKSPENKEIEEHGSEEESCGQAGKKEG
jgi:hypothetical protein